MKCKDCGLYPWRVGADLAHLPEATCHPQLKPRRFSAESIELEHDCPFGIDNKAEPVGADKVAARREEIRRRDAEPKDKPLEKMNKAELLAKAAGLNMGDGQANKDMTNKALIEAITVHQEQSLKALAETQDSLSPEGEVAEESQGDQSGGEDTQEKVIESGSDAGEPDPA